MSLLPFEHRSHIRTPALFSARLLLDHTSALYMTIDLSISGMAILGAQPLPVLENHALAIDVPHSSRRINAWGTVIYSVPTDRGLFRSGIRFIDMDAYSEACIAEFLSMPEPVRAQRRWSDSVVVETQG